MELERTRGKCADPLKPRPAMSLLAMTERPKLKMRILIIEDEAMIAFSIEQTLLADGFEIAGIAARLPAGLLYTSYASDYKTGVELGRQRYIQTKHSNANSDDIFATTSSHI